MATSDTTRARAPWTAYVLAIATGLGAAAALGGIAAMSYRDRPWLAFLVFAACTAGPLLAGAWATFVARHTVQPVRHAEDSVEHQWYHRAASGAFHDLMVPMGLVVTVSSVARWDFSGRTALLLALIFMGISFAMRLMAQKLRST